MLNQWEFSHIEYELLEETRIPIQCKLRDEIMRLFISTGCFSVVSKSSKHEFINLLNMKYNRASRNGCHFGGNNHISESHLPLSIAVVHPLCPVPTSWSSMPFCSQKPPALVMRTHQTCRGPSEHFSL